MSYLLLLIFLFSLPNIVQAQQLIMEGKTTVKYESRQYKHPNLADVDFVERTIRLTGTAPLSAQTSLFLRLGHQSYSGDAVDSAKTAIDQYGLRWKNARTTVTIGSQETYIGASGAIFDNSLNVGEGMLHGIDIRDKRGRNAYHLSSGRLDSALFDDNQSRSFFGMEWARYSGNIRLLFSYLRIPNLPTQADDFTGFSISSPMGKAEWLTEMIHSSAPTENQAFLLGMKYYPTKQQTIKLIIGKLPDNSVPKGKSSLGGYDNGIRGFQLSAIHALTPSNRLAVKYSHVKTITGNIPIRKTEIEYTQLF
ncbi:MAG: hypothetical protein H6Q69_4054 [Firmicutes bacterium]|nr:hypothetical protein [Bacillota bacterium]